MKLLRLLFLKSNQIPRWFIFLFDLGLCSVAYLLAVFTRYVLDFNSNLFYSAISAIPVLLLVKGITISYFRLQAFVIRYTSVQDGVRIFYAMGAAVLILFGIDSLHTYFPIGQNHLFPISILLIDFVLSVFLLAAFRVFVKLMYIRINMSTTEKKTFYAIYGAGAAGLTTKRKLEQESKNGIKVIAFFDDNINQHHKILEGITIYNGSSEMEDVIKKHHVEQLIIAIPSISKARKQDIIERCLAMNVAVRNVPPVEKWINGELSFNQIKNVKIEDLIERDVISLDKEMIGEQVNGRVIMVTGAGGSIGSEMVRQLLKFKPKKLLCVDKSEINLYQLDSYISENHPNELNTFVEILVGDITNEPRMRLIFEKYKPEIIYHAAAYKHVPLMEENPGEAVWVNIKGTKTIADLSVRFKTERFVMVSTDKAVNPTNVMGASKRIAEIYVQSLSNYHLKNNTGKTKFITTRFGNVLGSSGSVIPRFRKQIEEGGPITVTHPDITRYFMTIPEACQLVLEAGKMGRGGEIYIFDMGKSTRIVDLARKMVKLSGLTLGKDIQIVYTGLRPGEKIYEELLNDEENSLPTHHDKIMIGKVRSYDFEDIKKCIGELIEAYSTQDGMLMVAKMKKIVPEFKSKNSIFESLDNDVQLPDSSDLERMLLS
ncbi:MAG: nucleoside-diphosphate sugar epimerase/dehydratase [Bacteroidota bacterium]|nr:nucleoside-diphosphate sugar epimerase/dehydratase [Bacteroidota bacterium]